MIFREQEGIPSWHYTFEVWSQILYAALKGLFLRPFCWLLGEERIPHHSQSSQHYQAQFSQPHQAQFSQPQQPYFTKNIAPKQQFPSQPINLPTPLPVKHNFPTNRQVFGPPQPQNNVFHPKNSHKPTQKPEPMDTATRQTVRSNRFKPSGPRNFVAEELYNTEQTEPYPETFDYPDSYYDQSPYNANDIYSRTQTDFDLQKIEIPPQSIVAKDIRTSLPEGTELILDPLVYKDGAIEFSSCITKVKDQKATIEIRNNTGASQIFVLDKDFLQTFGTVIDPNEYECFSIENNSNHINSTCPTSLNFDQLRIDHLNFEEKSELYKLVKEFSSIFHTENEPLTFSNTVKHEIRTTDDIPIHTKSYRYPYVHKQEVTRQINKMLNDGIIRPSQSPWSSPIWIVPKKLDASGKQKWRIVVDYRKLNEKTIDDRYPIPNITDILDKLGRCNYFTTLDLASGFHQIELHPNSIPKTAFNVENGHYEFVRLPFGLKNAPSTFQRVMDNVLKELQGKVCLVYMDDIIIFSTSLQEHISNLKKVFQKLKGAGLKIQIDKCEFLCKSVEFLGHVVTPEGIRPNPKKIEAIKKFPIPKTAKEIKSFLGLIGYYRKFINNFAHLTKPLTHCLKKNVKIQHTPEFIKCFETCK
nr:unnamed protein product [Callosobruchus analis]